MFLQDSRGRIRPGEEDLVLDVTDNFHMLGWFPGSSMITLYANLSSQNEFLCEVLLKNRGYCRATKTIKFKGK